LNETYQQHTHYDTLTVSEFTDKFLRSFIPDDFFSALCETDKDNFIVDILTNVAGKFSEEVVKLENMKKIIDHRNKKNFSDLKSKMVDILIEERESKFSKLIQNMRNASDTIPKETAQKMKNTIQELLRKNIELKREVLKEKRRSELLYHVIQDINKKIAENKQKIANSQTMALFSSPAESHDVAIAAPNVPNASEKITASNTTGKITDSNATGKTESNVPEPFATPVPEPITTPNISEKPTTMPIQEKNAMPVLEKPESDTNIADAMENSPNQDDNIYDDMFEMDDHETDLDLILQEVE
jgi:hypothetical protein